jgi:biotin carboxyl carrier protein
MAFSVEVEGEVFEVKVTPSSAEAAAGPENVRPTAGSVAQVPGAVLCGSGGLLVSIHATVGEIVEEGVTVATIEAMKMIRELAAPHGGVVREIYASEGDLVAAEDVLMVVD